MRLDREGRRIAAHFLNGLAVAMLATLVFTPLSAGKLSVAAVTGSIAGAVALHIMALLLGRHR